MSQEFKNLKIIGAAVLVLAVSVLVILYFGLPRPPLDEKRSDLTVPAGSQLSISGGKLGAVKGNEGVEGDAETYRHPSFGFSFQYPKGFKAGSFQGGKGETIVVEVDPVRSQTPAASADALEAHRTSNGASGFQIYITPFDETGPLTFDRIKEEIPDLVVEEPQTVFIGQPTSRSDLDGERSDLTASALVFFSKDESLGKTREVWFVYPKGLVPNGNELYQITAYASFDAELSKIMATWRFE